MAFCKDTKIAMGDEARRKRLAEEAKALGSPKTPTAVVSEAPEEYALTIAQVRGFNMHLDPGAPSEEIPEERHEESIKGNCCK